MNQDITVRAAGGTTINFPVFDPLVREYCDSPASNWPTLVNEVFAQRIYSQVLRPENGPITFLDIGANIGLVSLFASDMCDRIVAVEPDPETFNVLHSMTFKHRNIECVCAALTPKDGEVDFYRNPENTTASSTVNTFGTKTTVRGLSLKSILSIHQLERVHVCKIDAEGAEEHSLNADQLMSARDVIGCYWIETHNTPTCRWEETILRLTGTLECLGYTKQSINGMRLVAEKSS